MDPRTLAALQALDRAYHLYDAFPTEENELALADRLRDLQETIPRHRYRVARTPLIIPPPLLERRPGIANAMQLLLIHLTASDVDYDTTIDWIGEILGRVWTATREGGEELPYIEIASASVLASLWARK